MKEEGGAGGVAHAKLIIIFSVLFIIELYIVATVNVGLSTIRPFGKRDQPQYLVGLSALILIIAVPMTFLTFR
jgi:hypothetical protein